MQSIEELLKEKENKKSRFNSERQEVTSQIYELYKLDTKRQNYKRYLKWLWENKKEKSNKMITEFKGTKYYIEPKKIRSFCFLISHIKTKDLYYLLSIGKDKLNRKENFGGWLHGEINKK